MAQDVVINGAQYNDVPSIALPVSGGGSALFYDGGGGGPARSVVIAGATYPDVTDVAVPLVGGGTTHFLAGEPVSEGIYGAEWNGTATTAWTRTDDAAGFADPMPYVAGLYGNFVGLTGSPFDNILPWSGMTVVVDEEAGELVAIPKYWYKWTKTGTAMKLQIANYAADGFFVSPAHADRGDGKGERDVVYVGRCHCTEEGWRSVPGKYPAIGVTRAEARTAIHNLGSTIWQYDFAMYWTIAMLYLVEFADWDSQAKIGYGCSYAGEQRDTESYAGYFMYHTGTSAETLTTYGRTQYRNIAGLWDNVYDWCDGIYFSGANVYCIKNPASFSDTGGGVLTGTRWTGNGDIGVWGIPAAAGFEYALYPSASGPSYVEDYYASYWLRYGYSRVNGTVLAVGGSYYHEQASGLFRLLGSGSASSSDGYTGCRLQKLP